MSFHLIYGYDIRLTHYAKALYLISKKILHMGTIAFEYGTNSLDECVKNLTIDTKRIVTEFVDIYLSEWHGLDTRPGRYDYWSASGLWTCPSFGIGNIWLSIQIG